MADDKTYPVLTEIEQLRWDAARSEMSAFADEVARGTLTEESLKGTVKQLRQLSIDTSRLLNSLHIPEDAGEYEGALIAILMRIPDGWGRWISCDPGWYRIIVELDAALADLAPDYVVHQVKEKFGSLRYYAGLPSCPEPECDVAFEREHPRPASDDAVWQAWADLWDAHCKTPEHGAGLAAVREPWEAMQATVRQQFNDLIDRAEERSAITCEVCGGVGRLRERRHWYKTLCDDCAERGGWS